MKKYLKIMKLNRQIYSMSRGLAEMDYAPTVIPFSPYIINGTQQHIWGGDSEKKAILRTAMNNLIAERELVKKG